jgi:DMSO/TMAO reductase YedYZ molybdopterin-dependent catalytic subunit
MAWTRARDPRAWPREPGRLATTAVGLASAASYTVGLAVVHTLVPRIPFPPIGIAQGLVRHAPGGFATFFIERLEYLALPSAAVLTSLAFLAFGAGWGWAASFVPASATARSSIAASASVSLWALGAILTPSFEGDVGGWRYFLLTFAVAALGAFTSRWIASRSIASAAGRRSNRAGDASADAPDRPRDPSRRILVASMATGGLALVLGASDLGRRLGLSQVEQRGFSLPYLREAVDPGASPVFHAISGLTPRLTPRGRFYVVDQALADPMLDPSSWRLRVFGRVRRSMAISYDELLRLRAVERFQTLECISNPVGGDLISTARWEGIPLAEILDRAGIGPGVVEVVFRSADGYSDSLPIEVAMNEGTLIAVGMDGEALPLEHGYPARVLGLGTYGMKNPKWLTSIEVVDSPYTGFWEERGWSRDAIVKTTARFDTPSPGSSLFGSTMISGVAFAGDRGISRVEVSTDGGETWSEAQLEAALSPLTWVRWRYPWPARVPGTHTLRARAFDGGGTPQSRAFAPPHPDGAGGYPVIAVSVRP